MPATLLTSRGSNARALVLGLALALIAMATGPNSAVARTSRDDLVGQMVTSLSAELPAGIKGIAIMNFENGCSAPLDIDLLREDFELELIGAPRFDFINRSLLEAALAEMDLCSGMECFMDPATLQEFGKAKGIDAMLMGEVIDSSTRYDGLEDKDYFTTVMLRAISTSTASVVWQKEVMGVNTTNVIDVLGALPEQQAITREEAFGREVAAFLAQSTKLKARNIRTVSLMNFENKSGQSVDMDVLFRYLTNNIVSQTDLDLVDRQYMEDYLKEQGLWFDRITEASQRADIGRLYGIDAFIYGTIRQVGEDQIECVVRVNDVETNVDIDAKKLVATAENMEWYLPDMLRNVGPSSFTSSPEGARVAVDGKKVGTTPCEFQLVNGSHEVEFSLDRYETEAISVVSDFGQGQKVHVDLKLAFSTISIATQPSGADLFVNGGAKGKAPLKGMRLPYGKHKVDASRKMFETASKSFTVDGPRYDLTIELTPKSKGKAILYSLLLPGAGQHYKGQHARGWLFTLGAAGSAGFALISENARKSAADDFEAARDAYHDAITQAEMDQYFAVMEDKWTEADDKAKLRDYSWYACGGIWLFNVVDAALGWPAADAGVTVGSAPAETGGHGIAVTVWR